MAQDSNFPKAILHVDGDSFFVSCELTRRPGLRGKPVVTGLERGIASAMSPEAKARGITRGMRLRDMRRLCPEVIILPSDYLMYAQYARRMYSIVRRYTDLVEEYSIDECFADLTASKHSRAISYEDLAHAIQNDLNRSLGISFSVGLGVNKVTAKIASKWCKPAGFTVIPRRAIYDFLAKLPVGKIWGIGSATTAHLRRLGVATALDLALKDRAWVAENCDKPLAEIYEEFQGNFVKQLELTHDPASIQRTRTFYPATRDRAYLWSQLSYHIEEACTKLRSQGLAASRASFFLKTQEFDYVRGETDLHESTASPEEILHAIEPVFEGLWKKVGQTKETKVVGANVLLFRAAGITLSGLHDAKSGTQTLFTKPHRSGVSHRVHATMDHLARKFGRNSVFLGSSWKALKSAGELTLEAKARAFDIIYLGEVT